MKGLVVLPPFLMPLPFVDAIIKEKVNGTLFARQNQFVFVICLVSINHPHPKGNKSSFSIKTPIFLATPVPANFSS
jgi:hypothetical protein